MQTSSFISKIILLIVVITSIANGHSKTEQSIIYTRNTAIIKSIVNNMVYVEGGTFTMGCTSEQGSDCDDNEKPAHQVTLSSYQIGKYEVTQAQWEAVMGRKQSSHENCPTCPAEEINLDVVQEFIKKLNAKTGKSFRLPTEAEWEYAARGGKRSKGYKYSGGDDPFDIGWFLFNSKGTTHPVGKKLPNELGLYDMSGNVWEWCQDWYGAYSTQAQRNPFGPSSGVYRLFRGGSWNFERWSMRVSRRLSYSPAIRGLGFRLALPSGQ